MHGNLTRQKGGIKLIQKTKTANPTIFHKDQALMLDQKVTKPICQSYATILQIQVHHFLFLCVHSMILNIKAKPLSSVRLLTEDLKYNNECRGRIHLLPAVDLSV